jgi:hypothetical protein
VAGDRKLSRLLEAFEYIAGPARSVISDQISGSKEYVLVVAYVKASRTGFLLPDIWYLIADIRN